MRTCSHCRREVPEDKKFCTYCGYRLKEPLKSEPRTPEPKNEIKKSKMYLSIVVFVIIILISSSIAYYIQTKEKDVIDSDHDGIPDSEDDFPEDGDFSAKLDVIDSNWYRKDETVFVV